MLPVSLIWLAPRLAPLGTWLEHTSYFVTDAGPHPATPSHIGLRQPTPPAPRHFTKE
jgi:hypothetical protein